jgi:pseudomonalisin
MFGRARLASLCRFALACRFSVVVLLCLFSSFIMPGFVPGRAAAQAQSLVTARPRLQVGSEIDGADLVVLKGNHPAAATSRSRIGLAAPGTSMEKMILVLKPNADQQRSLEALVQAQRDRKSPLYRKWLTPEAYAETFGVSDEDIAQVVAWLERQGFTVDEIPAGRRTIVFSGTAQQVSAAFHAEMARYSVGGRIHLANASDPQIPRALASVVEGVVALHDFRSAPLHTRATPRPQFNSGGQHYLSPADYASIYDITPLYSQGYTGSGQTIAIVARTNINLSDVQMFRSTFGLPAKAPNIVLNGVNPGIADEGDLDETTLDTEWSGAVAPNATIDVVVSGSTATSDGVYLSAQYAVNHNLAPVLSVSYGLCEADLGQAENSFLNSLWQQATAEGITVLVAAGDSGAAGCDAGSETRAVGGRAVNGICSTPYDTCVGGTEFNEGANASQYWSSSNSSTYASALGYIPETAWNETVTGGLWATGGGVSGVYTKPTWQSAPGVPADGMRDVPDVSLTAAGHDGYLICIHGSVMVISGTSAAAPSFAGLMGLVLQSTGAPQGNINPILYTLASRQQLAGGAAVFHDISTGNNSVPGVTGYNAGAGYDPVTGLGSVDANLLVTHWNDGGTAPTLAVSLGSNTATVTAGQKVTVLVTTTVGGGFAKAVSLSATGLPSGVTASFSPASIASPGAGQSTLTLTTTTAVAAATRTINIVATSGGIAKTVPLTLVVLPAPSFALAVSSTMTMPAGSSASGQVSVSLIGAFNASAALHAYGMPTGMTAAFSPATLAAPGSGSSTLSVSTAVATPVGTFTLTITGTGGGVTKSATIRVTVQPGPSFTVSAPAALGVMEGGSGTAQVTTALVNGFSAPISFKAAGMPLGMTATLSPATLAAPGSGSTSLSVAAASTVPPGTYTLSITGAGDGLTKTTTLRVTVAGITLTSSTPLVALNPASSASFTVRTTAGGGFSSALSLAVSGLPPGVTAAVSPASIAAPGTGSAVVTLTGVSALTASTKQITVTATGGGLTKTLLQTVTFYSR